MVNFQGESFMSQPIEISKNAEGIQLQMIKAAMGKKIDVQSRTGSTFEDFASNFFQSDSVKGNLDKRNQTLNGVITSVFNRIKPLSKREISDLSQNQLAMKHADVESVWNAITELKQADNDHILDKKTLKLLEEKEQELRTVKIDIEKAQRAFGTPNKGQTVQEEEERLDDNVRKRFL